MTDPRSSRDATLGHLRTGAWWGLQMGVIGLVLWSLLAKGFESGLAAAFSLVHLPAGLLGFRDVDSLWIYPAGLLSWVVLGGLIGGVLGFVVRRLDPPADAPAAPTRRRED